VISRAGPDDNAAYVAGHPLPARRVDERLAELRAGPHAARLPKPSTAEGRQLRRWVTQMLVTELLVDLACAELGVDASSAPAAGDVLPDEVAALEVGSVLAAVLASSTTARALYETVTADIGVSDDEVTGYRERNPEARDNAAVRKELLAAARRRRFTLWLHERRLSEVTLAPGYEHPADPRQPDFTHRH
jgi:[acyl-carrier-protein] S-malonyltransferase